MNNYVATTTVGPIKTSTSTYQQTTNIQNVGKPVTTYAQPVVGEQYNRTYETNDGRTKVTESGYSSTVNYNSNTRPMSYNPNTYMSNSNQSGQVNGGRASMSGQIISSTVGEPRLVDTRELEGRVVDIREKESRIIKETVTEGETRVVNERELKRERKSETRQVKKEVITTENVRKEKIIEIIKEKPVAYETYIDVAYDVIIDVPIERTIERERIVEVTIEKPFEKIIEIPVEQIIEIPVEKTIERLVEVQRRVDCPFERMVERPYEVIKENLIWSENVIDIDERDISSYSGATVLPTNIEYRHNERIVDKPVYIENIIEQDVEVPRQRIIQIPKDNIYEKKTQVYIDRPFPVDRVIEETTDHPVGTDVFRSVDFLVERPRYVENIIEQGVQIDRIVQKEVVVPVEHITERPIFIENIIERPVEHIVEVPVATERFMEIPIEKIHEVMINIERVVERPVERVVRKSVANIRQVPVNVEYTIEKTIEQPVEREIEKHINRYIEVPTESIVERSVMVERSNETANFIDKVTEIHLENVTENIQAVEKIVEKPVYIDTVLEKEVEYIVVRDVNVPTEKNIEVELNIQIQNPVYMEYETINDLNIDNNVVEVTENPNVLEETVEFDDIEFSSEIEIRKRDLEAQRNENYSLKSQFDSVKREFTTCIKSLSNFEEQENLRLRTRFEEVNSRLRALQEQKTNLTRKSVNRQTVVETVVKKNPKGDTLKSRLDTLVAENNSLVSQIVEKGEQVRKSAHAEANNRLMNKNSPYNSQNMSGMRSSLMQNSTYSSTNQISSLGRASYRY